MYVSGLGQSTDPGLIAGAQLWTSPTSAFSTAGGLISNLSTSISTEPLYTIGALLTPIAVLMIGMSLLGGRKR